MSSLARPTIREIFVRPENRLRVYFYTSSEAKYLQAFAVFQKYGLNLSYFRTRVDPYVEDYNLGKTTLLERAISEVRRSVGHGSLFFVEDTSVRFEALSTQDEDVPGLRVKEWFGETSFDELDTELRRRDRGRSAEVTSDIALHVPGLSRPVLFNGSTRGTVAESPPNFSESPQHPWLTPSSFNGWFVPKFPTKRLGEMSFEESFPFDFRVRALATLVDRLEEYAAIINLPVSAYTKRQFPLTANQLPLHLHRVPAFIIVCPPCAGKTTFGEYASSKFGMRFIEASSILRMFRDQYRADSIASLSDFDFAKHVMDDLGPDVVARRIIEFFYQDLRDGFVISGFRTIEELELFKSHIPNTQVVLIEASERTRYRRCLERGRSTEGMSLQQFRRVGFAQESLGLLRVAKDFADIKIINEGSLEDYMRQIASVVSGAVDVSVPGISRSVRPRHQDIHNQLYRTLSTLEEAGRPLTCEEVERMTGDMGTIVLANNANKVLKRVPGLARRLEMDGSRVRYELTNAGRAYLRYLRSRMEKRDHPSIQDNGS